MLTHFGICRFNRAPAYPVRWANDALGKLGLWLVDVKHGGTDGADGRGYAIAKGERRSQTGVFQLPGWDLMTTIRDRRSRKNDRCFYKDFIEPSVIQPSPSIPAMQRAA